MSYLKLTFFTRKKSEIGGHDEKKGMRENALTSFENLNNILNNIRTVRQKFVVTYRLYTEYGTL